MLRKNYTICQALFLLILCASIFITSCSKDDEPSPDNASNEANAAIAKKWMVHTNPSGRVNADASEFVWFEFTMEGYYIIFKSTGETLVGTYTYEDNLITLENLGTLEISDISDTDFSFTFTPAGSPESIDIFTSVADETVAASSKTDLLCKTWSEKRQYGNIFGIDYDEKFPSETIKSLTVVFSAYGTYLVTTEYTDGTKVILNRLWRWKDSEETLICYGDVSSECNGQNEATIMVLDEAAFKLHTVNALGDITDELVVFKK